MNNTTPIATDYFTSVISAPFAQTLFFALLIAVVLIVGTRIMGAISKFARAAEQRRANRPQISRAVHRQLVRDGYQLTRVNERAGFRNSKQYTYR